MTGERTPDERVPTQVSVTAPMVTPAARRAAVDGFLERYRKALVANDTKALASLWLLPALVVHDEGSRAVGRAAEVETYFGSAFESYRKAGVVDTEPEVTRMEWLSSRVVSATVRWRPLDAHGNPRGDDEWVTYTLREGDEPHTLGICVAVMHSATTPSVRGNA